MPDARTAREVTGYERGIITPLGSSGGWPVIADERIERRRISLGAVPTESLALHADDLFAVLDARLADVTDPDPPGPMTGAGVSAPPRAAPPPPSG